MKQVIALIALCAALFADTNIVPIVEFKLTGTNVLEAGSVPYTFDTTTSDWDIMARYFPATWFCGGTQFLTIDLVTNIYTSKTGGLTVTNQVLTVIAYNKTNEVILRKLNP